MTKGWPFSRSLAGPSALAALIAMQPAGTSDAQDAKQIAYGQHLSQECTSCHRIDGVDNGIPSILGWAPEAFSQTLGFYRSGQRTNPVMVSVASSLNDKQVEALAAYFASLPKPTAKASPATGKK